jgi:hypothetical protein
MKYEAPAQSAVEYVKQKLTLGANNRAGDVWQSRGASVTCVAGEKAAEMVMSRILARMDTLEKIRTIATMAENRKCGNCGEQVSVAFIYLYDRGIRPIDLMQFENADHGYVVLGRPEDARPVSSWGPEAYVADPWLGRWYQAGLLTSVWPGKFPTLTYRAK